MTITAVETGHYRVPLPAVLSDSTHGDIAHFELVTARVRTADGAEGLGYTYTVGAGAAAIRALLEELAPLLVDHDAERIEASGSACGGAATTWVAAASRPSRSPRRTSHSGISGRVGPASLSGSSSAAIARA